MNVRDTRVNDQSVVVLVIQSIYCLCGLRVRMITVRRNDR